MRSAFLHLHTERVFAYAVTEHVFVPDLKMSDPSSRVPASETR